FRQRAQRAERQNRLDLVAPERGQEAEVAFVPLEQRSAALGRAERPLFRGAQVEGGAAVRAVDLQTFDLSGLAVPLGGLRNAQIIERHFAAQKHLRCSPPVIEGAEGSVWSG